MTTFSLRGLWIITPVFSWGPQGFLVEWLVLQPLGLRC
jgi:hypothetical protein